MKAKISNVEKFTFTRENLLWAKKQIKKYPEGRQASAVMPLLTRAQEQHDGWLPMAAIVYVANMLEMPDMRVMEVATFYTMYNLNPVGKHVIEICTTTPCWLRGSDDVVAAAKDELGIGFGETTPDGVFTLLEVECAGACVNAPVCAIHTHYYEDLDAGSMRQLIKDLKAGKDLTPGPQVDRHLSAPAGGPTTLKEFMD
jgi:NADH-quinone oxidoreductase E subunit